LAETVDRFRAPVTHELLTDLDWMAEHVAALYVHDDNGRIVVLNVPEGSSKPAPYFFFGRTRHGNLWRFRDTIPRELVRELARLAGAEKANPDLEREPERLAVMLERVRAHLPAEIAWRGPAFRFPERLPRSDGVVAVTPANAELVADSFPDLHRTLSERLPCCAALAEGRAVSVCYCATRPGRAVEAGVDTLEDHRGRGLASRVTAAWAGQARRRNLLPLYSTSWENLASRGVARRLGLILHGSDLYFQ
jgi:hypothetical protein